jgi:hypothetical protein
MKQNIYIILIFIIFPLSFLTGAKHYWVPFIISLLLVLLYWLKTNRKPLMLGIYTITVLILYVFFLACFLMNKS